MSRKNSSNSSTEEGNNISSSRAQISPAIAWCFTFNNYTDEIVPKFQEIIEKKCRLGFFNKEVGESGTPHLQGYIELKSKGRPLNIFPQGAHWAKAKGNRDQNFMYCSKDCADNMPMTFKFGYKSKVPVRIATELRPFQQSIVDIIEGPVNEGKIIWIYDPIGQCGKTTLLKYLNVTKGIPFAYGGKAGDIINLAFNNREYLETAEPAVFIYNFGRDTDNVKISYKSMEQISDGCISNTKFEANCFVFNCPHVIVLANCEPLLSAMSNGRFIVKTIVDNQLIDYVQKNLEDEVNYFCEDY